MAIHLSKRLKTIYEMVPYGKIADVGADHGKLVISLSLDKKINYGIAIENKIGPFNRLKNAIDNSHVDNVKALFSNGIEDIDEDVDTVIIAGMGGLSIIDILKNSPSKIKNISNIIIDAHNAVSDVRKEITKMGFLIEDEKIVFESNKYYEIIKFSKTDKIITYEEADFVFGPILRKQKDILYLNKWNEIIKKMKQLLEKNTLSDDKISCINEEIERIENNI